MKKFILAAIAAASLFAIAPASAQTTSGMTRSVMDANAQVVVVRPGMRRGRMGMERRMMRREMMRRDMRRMDRRMDRRRMMMR